jgi:hypothetical protein
MALMTDVFNSWAGEPLEKQPLPLGQPDPAQQRYYVQQQYPQGQAWQQLPPQQPYQQVQVAYNYNSPAELPAQLATNYTTPAIPSPAISYTSPVPQNAMPHAPLGYGPPQGGAVEMLAELPGETLVAAPVPVPQAPMSTDVSSLSFTILARDLWGADSQSEEEKVSL